MLQPNVGRSRPRLGSTACPRKRFPAFPSPHDPYPWEDRNPRNPRNPGSRETPSARRCVRVAARTTLLRNISPALIRYVCSRRVPHPSITQPICGTPSPRTPAGFTRNGRRARSRRCPSPTDDGATNVDGLYIVGDLTGVPLLKLSANAGTNVIRKIADELEDANDGDGDDETLDVAIIGGGTSGFAAALEAEKKGPEVPRVRGDRAVQHDRQLPQGKADLPLPVRAGDRGRARVPRQVRHQGRPARRPPRADRRERHQVGLRQGQPHRANLRPPRSRA